jgi:prenyltransferase beta subunit
MLDEISQQEVISFIKSQQHSSGAFVNRGGNPDFYYSLFGAWLAKGLSLNKPQSSLKKYVSHQSSEQNYMIDRYALLLIRLAISEKNFRKPHLISFLKTFFQAGQKLNPAYRAFLFLLSFDALFKRQKFFSFLLKIILSTYRTAGDIPCSYRAAWLMARQMAGFSVDEDMNKLYEYFEEGVGFKVFKETKEPDLLSTAVAVFVLKRAGADLRLIAPDALQLVQQNYNSGAFLAGNGDAEKDLEYTFYGLLILGLLS